METSKRKNSRYLEYYPKNGESPKKCLLRTGKYTIGFASSHIFIKSKNQDLEPVSCLIEVKENCSAILRSLDKHSVLFGGVKLKRSQILKNGDIFTISGNVFRYMNNLQTETPDLVMIKRVQSITKTKKRSIAKRRSLVVVKKKRISDLCHKKRTSVSKAKSLTPRINRGREGNDDSLMKTYKHKHSETKLVLNLSNSHASESSISNKSWLSISSCYDSASTSTAPDDLTRDATLRRTPETSSSSLNDSTNLIGLRTKEPDLTLSISDASESSIWSQVWPSFSSDDYDSASTSTALNYLTRDKKLFRTSGTSNLPLNDLTNVSSLETKEPMLNLNSHGSDPVIWNKVWSTTPNDLTRNTKSWRTSETSNLTAKVKTPRKQKSPENDLMDVRGVKEIFKTPNPHKSPKNDLSDVGGLEQLFKTPHDGSFEISKQKLFLLRKKGKRNCAQFTADVNNPKLKNSKQSPKRHGPIKKQSAELRKENPQPESDIEEEVMGKKSRHGHRKLDETVEKEETGVRQKRNLSSRRKHIVDQNRETIRTDRKRIGSGIEARKENSSIDNKEVKEISKNRGRGRRKGVFEECKETLESTDEKSRIASRKKKTIEERNAETVGLPNDRNSHDQRKKNINEKSLEVSESSNKNSPSDARRFTRKKIEDNKTDIKEVTCHQVNGSEGKRKPTTRGRRQAEARENANHQRKYNTRSASKKS